MKVIFDKEVFAKRLRELMQDNGDTVYSLGEYLKLSPPIISRYINAVHAPKQPTIKEIAKKYKVNPAWLMGAEGASKYLEDKPKYKLIPILGKIAAGMPILAEEHIEGYEQIEESEDVTFCLRVTGNSMIGARIYDGDIVFVHQQDDVENGEIAAVIIDGEEATLKRVYKRRGEIVLHAENPTIPDMIFTARDRKEVKIIGKVKYVKFEAR